MNRLKTALIGDKDIPEFDRDIMTNLLIETVELKVVRESKMLLGIRNAKHEIYRVIGASHPNQFTNASEEIGELGLSNEPDKGRAKDGYDAIFSLTK